MAGEQTIEVEGRVVESLPNPTVLRVELPNGHRIVAHLSGAVRMSLARFEPGDIVRVEMSPYDLSKGKILAKKD